MTQQIDPRLLEFSPTVQPGLVEQAAAQTDLALPTGQPQSSGNAAVDFWNQRREQEATAAEPDPERQAFLEQQHGSYETAATQFARGALDALLAPGALVGAEAEVAGTLLKNRALRDFGRDLGKAASGRSAAEALSFVFGGGAENIARSAAGQEVEFEEQRGALEDSEHAVRQIDEQEEARPGLATVSRIAGLAAAAIGMGSAASAGSKAATSIAANVAEGAAGGAQAAYEKSAPLRDVLTSAAIGGALSGTVSVGAEVAQAALKRAPDLARVFGEKVQEFADTQANRQVLGKDRKAWRFLSDDPDRAARVADRIRSSGLLGKSDEEMREILGRELGVDGAKIGAVARQIDEDGIVPQVDRLMAGLDEVAERYSGGDLASMQRIGRSIRDEVQPFKDKLLKEVSPDLQTVAERGLWDIAKEDMRSGMRGTSLSKVRDEYASGQAMRPVELTIFPDGKIKLQDGRHRLLVARNERGLTEIPAKVSVMNEAGDIVRESTGVLPIAPGRIKPEYRPPTFAEVWKLKQGLGKVAEFDPAREKLANDALKDMWKVVARETDAAADAAGPTASKLWRAANESYSDMKLLDSAVKREIARKSTNRGVSLTDYQSGIGAAITAAVMGVNPIGALAAAAGGALANKAGRTIGSGIMSSLANRFARISTRVSARGAGAETREVLNLIAKSRAFVDDTVARAGDNPATRQAAAETAKRVAAEQIGKKAGVFVPSEWASKPLSAVQKMVYRGQILDAVADDLSRVAKEAHELRVPLPATLDPKRIAKLTRDARGPEAIGSVQTTLGSIAEQAPPTALGDAAGVALRNVMISLDRTNVPETMAKAHELARWLDVAAENSSDEIGKNFANRASLAIKGALGGESFGSAGKLYRQMIGYPNETMRALADAKAVRESLRKYAEPGHLPAIIAKHNDDTAAGFSARFKLAGEDVPQDLGEKMRRASKIFHAAELAVTLDGKPMASMFDASNAAGVYEGTDVYLHGATTVGDANAQSAFGADAYVNEHTVQDAVDPELNKILPVLRGGQRAIQGIVPRQIHTMTPAEQRAEYDQRVDRLARIASNPAEIDESLHPTVATSMMERMNQLLADMPKPTPSFRGKAFETMSSEDLRLANSMWEATTKPLSVFSDFAGGAVDYDKVQYAWKQWPGLQQAAQAGVMDLLTTELTEPERAKIPESVITQLDYMLGMNGALQPTLNFGFGQRMSALYQPEPNKPQPGGTMQPTPAAEPTFTQRLSGSM